MSNSHESGIPQRVDSESLGGSFHYFPLGDIIYSTSFDLGVDGLPKYPKKIRYYTDFDTDFIGSGVAREFDFDYSACDRLLFRIGAFILYRLIATPVAFLHSALVLRQRVIGRKKLRGVKGGILVLNHTERIGDAFTPSVISFPTRCFVVVHADNLSLPVLGGVTSMLGAVPIPHDRKSAREYSLSIEKKLRRGDLVAIYPEAHLWEKYSGIRPFKDAALDPAVRNNAPVFACTRVYKKSRILGYKTRLYIDGPFYADVEKTRSAAARELSRLVHGIMTERAAESNVEVIRYEKRGTENQTC